MIIAFILLSACGGEKETFVVEYDYETPPIASEGDAADDPAIFLTEGDPLILATDKTAGMYIYMIQAGDFVSTKKMVLLK